MPRDPLSITFAAVAEPTRRALLDRLRAPDASVVALAGPFRMTGRPVSKHLRARGRWAHPARARRAATAEPSPGRSWADGDRGLEGYRRLWSRRFDRLDGRLKRQQKEKHHDPTG